MIFFKHQRCFVITLSITLVLLASQTAFDVSAQVSGSIPSWVKNNAKFWSDGQISDSDFVKGIQYMLENGIISIPPTPGGNLQNSNQIPSWIKNNAGLWADGQIDDSEFAKGMQYLIQTGIIQVSIVQQVNQTVNTTTNPASEQSSVIPTSCTALNGGILPDPLCTPGVIDPRVTQENIDSTICVSGYTKTVRPSSYVTNKMKLQSMKEYGFTDSPSNYEYDHLIPLELGGSPQDSKNLWPESRYSSYDKDAFENWLHGQVCSGKIDLKTAQDEIATNWVKYRAESSSP